MSSRWHVQDGHLSIMKNRDWHTMYSISVRPGRSRYLGVCLRVASYMSVGSVGGIKSGLHNESRRYLGCTGREGSCGYIENISHSFDSSPCQLHIFGSFHHWNGVFCSYALRMKGPYRNLSFSTWFSRTLIRRKVNRIATAADALKEDPGPKAENLFLSSRNFILQQRAI